MITLVVCFCSRVNTCVIMLYVLCKDAGSLQGLACFKVRVFMF